MKVKDVLKKKSADMIVIQPEQSLHDASQLLAEHNIGALVVVDDAGETVGILSERDIVRCLASLKAGVVEQAVKEAMTEDIIIGFLEDELSYVSNVMIDKRIRHLPIMEEHNLIGMISIGDVVKAQLEHYAGEAHMLRQYITGEYQ